MLKCLFRQVISSSSLFLDKSLANLMCIRFSELVFFKAMRSEDVDTIISSWLASHPKAQVIPVTAISLGAKRGQLIYVCIEDDNENL